MALTMTRTRTQTTLTRLAALLATLNDELEVVRALRATEPAHSEALAGQEAVLQKKREAVITAIGQFDPLLDPEAIGMRNASMRQRC